MKHLKFPLIALTLFTLCLSSCSNDDDEYRSEPPLLSNLTVRSLDGTTTDIHVGERFIITAEQRKKGRLLNATKYTWESNSEDISHKYTPSVIYDQESENPTDTLIAQKAGRFTITFKGKYNASGNTSTWSNKYGGTFQESLPENGKVTYTTGGILFFTVTAEKSINILP